MLRLLTFTIALYLFHLSLGGAQSVLDEAEGYAVRVKASIGYPLQKIRLEPSMVPAFYLIKRGWF